jgi:hypothetical protein
VNRVRTTMIRVVIASAILWGLAPGPAVAGELEAEIAHLLEFVAESGCTFIRNGSEHSAQSAREHMETKYAHVKQRVRTSEQFIEYAASRSSITGRAYTIRCGEVETPSGEWLIGELARYRARSSASGPTPRLRGGLGSP